MTPPTATLATQMDAVTRLFTQDQTTPHPLTPALTHPPAPAPQTIPGAAQAPATPPAQAPDPQPTREPQPDTTAPLTPPPAFHTPHTGAPTAPVFIPAHTRIHDLLPAPSTGPGSAAEPEPTVEPDETPQVEFTPVAETVEAHTQRQQSVRAVIEELSWLDD